MTRPLCGRPPWGWFCTRLPRHDGPCQIRPRAWNLPGVFYVFVTGRQSVAAGRRRAREDGDL